MSRGSEEDKDVHRGCVKYTQCIPLVMSNRLYGPGAQGIDSKVKGMDINPWNMYM